MGSSKNAGKTTAMLRILMEARRTGLRVALMSTGRDGESTDRITGTPKPSIHLEEGELVVTTWKGVLEGSGEVVAVLRGRTTEGTAALWRVHDGMRVETAGLLSASSVWETIDTVRKEAPGHLILVDGALDRWAALAHDSPSVILVVGPMDGIETMLRWTVSRLRLLSLSVWDGSGVPHIHDGPLYDVSSLPSDVPVLVESPMHVFVHDDALSSVKDRLWVRSKPTLRGVAINPWSPGGKHVSPRIMMESIRRIAPVPVFCPLCI